MRRRASGPGRTPGRSRVSPAKPGVRSTPRCHMASRRLPGGTTLRRLLLEHRGPQATESRPDLTIEQILAWADAYFEAAGTVAERGVRTDRRGPEDKLESDQHVAAKGRRGLPGGTTLERLLVEHRGEPAKRRHIELTVEQILAWADTHYEAAGSWPTAASGPVARCSGAHMELGQHHAAQGRPGPAGRLDACPLAEAARSGGRDWPMAKRPSALTVDLILSWADAYHEEHGNWPNKGSGPVPDAPKYRWSWVDTMLREGVPGLPGGSTLARLLEQHGRAAWRPRQNARTALTVDLILSWADAYHQEHGNWPSTRSGAVPGAPAENWNNINQALWTGRQGLPPRMSLARLLAEKRGARNQKGLPTLSINQIVAWAEAHHAATGKLAHGQRRRCPKHPPKSGLRSTNLRTATVVDQAARHCAAAERNTPRGRNTCTLDTIRAWGEAHHTATGRWPRRGQARSPAHLR